MTFQWDDIRIFLAVVNHGSLPQAAKGLKMAHSTVFRRLNAFEDQIGVRLFDRLSTGFVLTSAGESILEMAQAMEDRSEEIARAVAGQDYKLTGPIRVATTHGLSLNFMGPIFKAFVDQHPGVQLHIQWENQVQKLSKYKSDVIVLPSNKPPQNAFGRKLGKIHFRYFACADYLDSKNLPEPLSELTGHEVVALSEDFEGQPFYAPFMAAIEPAKVTLTCDSFLTVREAIAVGAGIGLLPTNYGLGYKNLRPLNTAFAKTENDLWILTHNDLKNTVRIRTFMDFVYAQTRNMEPGFNDTG